MGIALLAALPGAAAASSASDALLARMVALNPGLHSFQATVHADVTLKTFPFLTTSLVATLYHKEPGRNKLVVSSGLPLVAQQFDKLYADIPGPAQWRERYVVTLVSDDGKTSAFSLVPRKKGNVDSIEVKVDDRAATVSSWRWNYANGGYAELANRYARISGNTLVSSQTAHVSEPGYTADITSTLDNYTLNPPLTDDFFTQ